MKGKSSSGSRYEREILNAEVDKTIEHLRGQLASLFEMNQMPESLATVDTSTKKNVLAKWILRQRRRRDNFFSADLFGEPAWDMLLELYAHALDQRRISISALCTASGVPATTALRWIGNLERAGLIVRRNDPTDLRRVWLELTSDGSSAVDQYFDGLV